MLSYRKSQQVSLTEKLKKKTVIHVFGVSGSGTTMARFCLSAFVRVATYSNDCTVYMGVLCHSAFVRVATRLNRTSSGGLSLCHSAFVRVATGENKMTIREVFLCLSAFVRVATTKRRIPFNDALPLPQRIRAGCDSINSSPQVHQGSLPQRIRAGCDPAFYMQRLQARAFATAHSCGLRL